ncbi:hypothetical protein ACMBCN_02645 [Candidatus Liberibacter asiaticus]
MAELETINSRKNEVDEKLETYLKAMKEIKNPRETSQTTQGKMKI